MAEHVEAFYFGRFQPPLLKHAEIATSVDALTGDGVRLTVGIAESAALNQNNFLTGEESKYLFEATLRHIRAGQIELALVPIDLEHPLSESVRAFLQNRNVLKDSKVVVFSGSPSTILACEVLRDEYDVSIVDLKDDDKSGPRARMIRQALIRGDFVKLMELRELVAPEVIEFLATRSMADRMKQLPNGEKRPWTSSKA